MRISMNQTRDSVNNALYVKAILEQADQAVVCLVACSHEIKHIKRFQYVQLMIFEISEN